MLCPTNLQKLNLKYFLSWTTQKWKRVDQCMHILNLKILIDFFFFSLLYKEFHINFIRFRLHHLLCPDLFSDFQKLLYIFLIFLNNRSTSAE
jgi:hypothetical protein